MSTKQKFHTTTCPKCNQTLPGWAQVCQFCGSQIAPSGFVGSADQQIKQRNMPTWTEAAYVVVGILITLEGLYNLLLGFNIIPNPLYSIGFGTFLGIFGAVRFILGLAMLFHQEWAQFILKWMCVLAVIGSGFSLLRNISMLGVHMMFVRQVTWVDVLISFLTVCLYGFAIYILNVEGDV